MKKIAIIGSGTAGMLSVMHFSKWTDCEIELYHDTKIKPQAVGEGSATPLPLNLHQCLGFTHSDLTHIDGSFKYGIRKIGWTNDGDFVHHFRPPSIAYHFNAVKLQKYILDKLKGKIKIIEKNVTADNIDSDFVMDCSGSPKDFTEFTMSEGIPVNSVYVTQCYWDYARFFTTLTIARPYGWVFGIPLQNRCSIGYMYNNNINTLEEVKEDVKQIFEDFNLVPSDNTNNFSFRNYYRKQNHTGRISYNGNASFFLEPMEATSITTMDVIQREAYDIWFENRNVEEINCSHAQFLEQVEEVIMLHYFAGSIYDTKFWNYAKERSEKILSRGIKHNHFDVIIDHLEHNLPFTGEYGTWSYNSFVENIDNLNIMDKLIALRNTSVMG